MSRVWRTLLMAIAVAIIAVTVWLLDYAAGADGYYGSGKSLFSLPVALFALTAGIELLTEPAIRLAQLGPLIPDGLPASRCP